MACRAAGCGVGVGAGGSASIVWSTWLGAEADAVSTTTLDGRFRFTARIRAARKRL